MEVQIMGSHLYELVKKSLPYQRNFSNKRDVRNMGSRTIESLMYSLNYFRPNFQ